MLGRMATGRRKPPNPNPPRCARTVDARQTSATARRPNAHRVKPLLPAQRRMSVQTHPDDLIRRRVEQCLDQTVVAVESISPNEIDVAAGVQLSDAMMRHRAGGLVDRVGAE